MPITPFLHGQSFDPEIIEVMSSVFVQACANLGLSEVDDAMTQQAARHVIEPARRGIRTDATTAYFTLRSCSLRECNNVFLNLPIASCVCA
jgi:hypothetical protein